MARQTYQSSKTRPTFPAARPIATNGIAIRALQVIKREALTNLIPHALYEILIQPLSRDRRSNRALTKLSNYSADIVIQRKSPPRMSPTDFLTKLRAGCWGEGGRVSNGSVSYPAVKPRG